MPDRFYPRIQSDEVLVLNSVFKNLEIDPTFLDYPECPYSEDVKAFFRKPRGVLEEVEDLFAGDEEKEVVLDRQVEKLLNDLEAFAKTLGKADHSEKLAYFKSKTTLLEKLLSMRERLSSLKEINDFKMVVMQFLDEECTKDQITNLMNRLGNS